jgi:lysozyme family protein
MMQKMIALSIVSLFGKFNGVKLKKIHSMENRVSTTIEKGIRIGISGFFLFLCCGSFVFCFSGRRPVHALTTLFKPMADFNLSQLFVHQAEGGFQIDPRDRGNWTGGKIGSGTLAGTNWGISAMYLSSLLDRPVTRTEMELMKYEDALYIYRSKFWDSLRLGDLVSQELATLIYDCAVNQGVTKARDAMKHAIKHSDRPPMKGVKTAGDLVKIINQLNSSAAYEVIWQFRRDAYPKSSPFYHGWMKRMDRLKRSG